MTNRKSEIDIRLERVRTLELQGINPYPHDFTRTNTLLQIRTQHDGQVDTHGKSINLNLAGRVMNVRTMGKLVFVDVEDRDSRLQFILQPGFTSAEIISNFKEFVFRGDWIGFAVDHIFVTGKGELSARVSKWTMLAPCLLPLPHHIGGHERQRKERYIHLAVEQRTRQRFVTRSKIVRHVRRFLEDEYGLLEVKTPAIQPIYGGAEARPFTTYINDAKTSGFLRISPETYLKRLVVGGLEGVYEICTNYRNEGIDWSHYPEFQMMECYLSPADLSDMMTLTERLISGIAFSLHGSHELEWQSRDQMKRAASLQDKATPLTSESDFQDELSEQADFRYETVMLDLTPPWPRRSIYGMALEATGVDFLNLTTIEQAVEVARSMGLQVKQDHTFTSIGGVALFVVDELIYPTLIQPTFVVDFPFEECPLTKRHRQDPRLAERFELFINGMEFANAYTELTDPREQEAQFVRQAEKRDRGDEEAQQTDDDYVNALKYGLPPTGGLGIGIDRLVMLMTSAADIRDVIFFPIYNRR